MNDDIPVETTRAGLRYLYERLRADKTFTILEKPALQFTYHVPSFAVSSIETHCTPPAVAIPVEGWDTVCFLLRFIVLGQDRMACIMSEGLVIVEPFFWDDGYLSIPEVIDGSV
jgi:hypothetical protein